MDFKQFLKENINFIKANSITSDTIISKNDDLYYEDNWDEYYDELKNKGTLYEE